MALSEKDILEITKTVGIATEAAITNHFKDFFISRESHWEDHRFLGNFRQGIGKAKTTAIKTVTTTIVITLISLVVWGLVAWGKKQF